MKAAGWLALAAWVYLVLLRGRFWRPPSQNIFARSGREPLVVAIIPARNEAAVIRPAVASLLNQTYRNLRIIVVDDHSTDGTASIAGQAALGDPGRLRVLAARALPRGWTGKVWAMSEGLRAAADLGAEYYLFTDSDIVHAGENVSELVARAESGRLGLASLMVKLRCVSMAERALVPAFVYFFFKLYPPRWIASRDRGTAGAAGGCMLARAAVLSEIGGVERIRGELIDDCALAKAVKSNGASLWLGLSPDTRSVREYKSFASFGRMVSRTAYTQLRHSPVLLAGSVAGMLFLYVGPPVLAFSGSIGAAAAWLLMGLSFVPILRFYDRSILWGALLPLIALFYTGCTIHSAVSHWRGTGGMWKGRAQGAAGGP